MNIKIFLILSLLVVICVSAFADTEINTQMTLRKISETSKVPVRKVIEYLKLDRDTNIDIPVHTLGITQDDLKESLCCYNDNKHSYYTGIVVVGMGTVFVSLIVVALLIAQLRFLDKKKKPPIKELPEEAKVKYASNEDEEIIAAITTTLYLYELEREEHDKLILTWKRAPVSMWKSSNFIPMNEVDPSRRK